MSGITQLVGAVAVPLGCVLGAATAVGVLLLAAGTRARPTRPPNQQRRGFGFGFVHRLPKSWRGPRLATAGVSGVVVGMLTGWPVGGFLAAVGVLTLPELLGPDRQAAAGLARMEAVATWTEMLRDTLSAAAGLEQAILATAPLTPPPLRDEVRTLAGRLKAGEPLPSALEGFGRDVDDPAADTVVTVLVMASRRQAARLGPLLGSLAGAVREQVAMRQRIAASRASTRTSVRVCCATTLALAAALVVFNRPYLQPFDSAAGQLALAAAGGLFAASFAWLGSMARIPAPPRLLALDPPGAVREGAGAR
ncbi:type II secretion system F family protein [Streptomyces sp. 4N509B]|uniref:type II secretion system F family protein n=1 Tax=Streptomyces sp. 4N509B TaxID=3457413 RepID=UPI003FD673DB